MFSIDLIMQGKKSITFIFRKPFPGSRSIENLFYPIAKRIQEKVDFDTKTVELPNHSKGFWPRLKNVLSLLKSKGGIVHVTGDVYYGILGAWFSKKILTYHDLSFLDRSRGIKRSILKFFWLSLPARFAHQLTTVSEATKQSILNEVAIKSSKITVIPNFIDPIFKPRLQIELNNSCPRVLLIGTDFNKNLENVIPALSGLNVAITIVGNLKTHQKRLLTDHEICYQNEVDINLQRLYEFYVKADLLLFCSTVEGFGLPILEAQATGIPVITSNLSSMPEIAGNAAILVNPYDRIAIQRAVKDLIQNQNLRNSLSAKGLENVKRFRFDAIVEQYYQLYRSLN